MAHEIQHYFAIFDDDFDHFDWQFYDWFLKPVMTPKAVKQVRDAYQLTKDVATYNAVFNRMYKASLDYLTVNFAGRRTGQLFLLALQTEMVGRTPLDYDNKILHNILHDIKFDLHDFLKHRAFAKASLLRNHRHFHRDGLTALPSSLIYFQHQHDAIKIEHLPQCQIFNHTYLKNS